MQCGMLFDNNEAHCPFDAWHHTCVQYFLKDKESYLLSLVPDNSLPISCWPAMIHRKALDKQTRFPFDYRFVPLNRRIASCRRATVPCSG